MERERGISITSTVLQFPYKGRVVNLLDTAKGADLGSAGSTLVVDLNFLYHPSCRYNDAWQCPLAPPGNTIATPVTAGERLAICRPERRIGKAENHRREAEQLHGDGVLRDRFGTQQLREDQAPMFERIARNVLPVLKAAHG